MAYKIIRIDGITTGKNIDGKEDPKEELERIPTEVWVEKNIPP